MDRTTVDFEGRGIRRVCVVNQLERADVVRWGEAKVRVRGTAADPERGFIHHQDTVYLMGFEGSIECPAGCLVNTRSGEADLEAALVRFYAPSFAPDAGGRPRGGAPATFRVVPDDVVARATERFSSYTSFEWLAAEGSVTSPVARDWIQLNHGNQHRFGPGGEHDFLQAAPSGEIVTIPELRAVRAIAEIPDAVSNFLTRCNIYGDLMSLMLDETSQLMTVRDPNQLRRKLEEVQQKLAELHGVATGARQLEAEARSQMLEAIARLRELKVPFGAEMEPFAGGSTPLSNELWATVVGRVASLEARLSGRVDPDLDLAPASSNVTRSNAAQRESANVNAAATSVTTYSMCLTQVTGTMLRAQFIEHSMKHREYTMKNVDDYLRRSGESRDATRRTGYEWPSRYRYDFDVDEKKNVRRIRETGEPCDNTTVREARRVSQKPSAASGAGSGSDGGSSVVQTLKSAANAFIGVLKNAILGH